MQRALKGFRPKVRLNFEKGRFQVRTIESWEELEQVLRLRYEVFYREGMKRHLPIPMDLEKLDPCADHLVIVDKNDSRIVGTYRFISSSFSEVFYSESEFCLYEFLRQPGVKLELSRACIHRDYRTGPVMHLLWRGLIEYIRLVDARFLFGCASVKTVEMGQACRVFQYLQGREAIATDLHVHPLPRYRMMGFQEELQRIAGGALDSAACDDLIPPLFNAYLKAGARIYGEPALDKDFQCVDFFTVLDMHRLTEGHARKYTK